MLQNIVAACLWVVSAGLSNRNELFDKYGEVFPHGNRNAASHRWATYILERSMDMTEEVMRDLFAGFCPVSGSPLGYNRQISRWNMTLPDVTTGGTISGALYYCCWPCVCDTQDFIHVDTKSVQTADGTKQYQWVVIGNPCAKPDAIPLAAPDVNCEGDQLVKATLSDNGHVIIGMFFEPGVPGHTEENSQITQMDVLSEHCQARADSGHQSGMGMIFREVANISPIIAAADPSPSPTVDGEEAPSVDNTRVAAAVLEASTTTTTQVITESSTLPLEETSTSVEATTTTPTTVSTSTTVTTTSTTMQTSTTTFAPTTALETTSTEVQSTTSGTITTTATTVQKDATASTNAETDADLTATTNGQSSEDGSVTAISTASDANDEIPSTTRADEALVSTMPQRPEDYIPASADTLSAAYSQHPLLCVASTLLGNMLYLVVLD